MTDPSNGNHKTLFVSLTTMLSMSALQQLGKLMNPLTRKTEINLEAAQSTIDMLDMLEAKTRGNLDAEEAKLMRDTLAMLKMNYVETADSKQSAVSGPPSISPPRSPGRSTPAEPGSAMAERGAPGATEGGQPPAESPKAEAKDQRSEAGGPAPADQKPEDKSPKFRKTYE